MKREPQVSILLPAYNAGGMLAESLVSLRDQTLADWECILVDDGSTDQTAEVAAEWSQRDLRIRLLSFPQRLGIVVALNAAAAAARAPLLARQDADDRADPERLERQVALIRSDPTLAAVACQVRLFPHAELPQGLRDYEAWLNRTLSPEQIAREIWVESPLPHPATLIRREAWAQCGPYAEGPWPEDYDLWLRMHLAGWRFAKVPAPLYAWRHHAMRLTFTDPRYAPAAFLECKLRHLVAHLTERRLLIWGAGRDGKRLGRALIARGVSPDGFIDIDRRKVGRTRLGLPVFAPEEALPPDPHSDSGERAAVPRPRLDRRRLLILVAVGSKGARGLIRERLAEMGFREPDDFLCLH